MSKITNEDALNAYEKFGSQRKAADALGISRRHLRTLLNNAVNKKYNVDKGYKVTKVSKTYNSKNEVTGTSVVTKLEPHEEEVDRDGKIARRSTLYGVDGSVIQEWVIRKPEDETDKYIDSLKKYFSDNVRVISAPALLKENRTDDDLALFMSIDEHINVKVVYDQGGEDYGLEDSIHLMYNKFEKIVDRTNKTKKALFVNLGDQFHANDHMDVTPASKNKLDSDQSFFTASDAVVNLNMAKIDYLLKNYEEVEIKGVSGNHDIDPMGWLFRCLKLAYRNEPRVKVDFYNDEVFAYQFENTLLGFHHGHRMKPDVMAGVVADRNSKMYGDTTMRYLHTGHIHHDSTKDIWGGFKWHSHRTMAPKDWYSFSKGYITRQSMKSYIYNKDEGEVANYTTSLV